MSAIFKSISQAILALAIFSLPASAHTVAQAAPKPDPKSIAEVDAGLGPCTADFTITTTLAHPSTPSISASTSPTDS